MFEELLSCQLQIEVPLDSMKGDATVSEWDFKFTVAKLADGAI